MKSNLIYLCTIFVPLFAGCDFFDTKLNFYNNSSKTISIEVTNDTASVYFNKIEYYLNNVVSVNDTVSFSQGGIGNAWSRYINKGPQKRLFVYIFDLDTLTKYKEETMLDIVRSKKYTKLLNYSIKQLDSINWVTRLHE